MSASPDPDAPGGPAWTSLVWMENAACRDEDPELFFPVSIKAAGAAQAAEAKEVCAQCPVREPCRDYALRTRQDAGIWGGLTDEERLMMRRRGSRVRRGDSSSPLAGWPRAADDVTGDE